ncbi:UDP-glucuronosyltransferase 1-9 [Fopius arisanus]|uniref:UDP-glucuronosyltransferase n=1 Tax=Fopius arisanus TaxID=64838 RepID=A0A9R1SUB8_9HYME|nr:PREDICTED: UDP-glucuronosyltransferase 1-9-like [Fopius arisanus]XP_011297293.1 PREDICTED: UDP-glucuronosyltransferase 1-9-like [Fopius arisanus]
MTFLRALLLLGGVLILQTQGTSALRVLGVFPLPGKSHFILAENLLKEMARRGHSVDMVSHFPTKNPIPNYRDISLRGSLPIAVNNISFEETRTFSGFSMAFFVRHTGTQICELLGTPYLEELLRTPKGTYDVIIVELFTAQCYIALGKHLDAPVVGLVASKMHDWLFDPFANPLNPSYMPSLFSSFSQRMTFWERLTNTFVMNVIGLQINYYLNEQIEYVEKNFNRRISSINDLYNDVSLLLVNEHFSINEIKPATPDVIDVGGLHVHDDDQMVTPELEKWLDASTEGCVYFTFGSMIRIETLPPEKLKILYETFEKIAPVRVLMKIADPKILPKGLPKNVMTSSWMPQVAVLKHKNVRAFITHGGLLGTQEALAHKVPMIGIPLFGDQHTNIRTYQNKNIAIALSIDTLSVDGLTNAIIAVLNDPKYRKNIAHISDLFLSRPMSALDTAVYWVEYTARHGTVMKSPATELSWWQLYLLDVYGFIITCALIILYVLKKIVTTVWSCCKRNQTPISKSKKNR